jgi:glycosyltransferase involved in cell wall biosynthesis
VSDATARRILVILEAGDAYPSGFIRGLIYRDAFRAAGFDVTYVNRQPPVLTRLAERAPGSLAPALGWLFARWADFIEPRLVRLARAYDIVYMSKVTSYRLVSALRQQTRVRLVLDFGDAVWLNPWAGHFNKLLGLVHAVTTDNALTAAYVRQYNPNCLVVPDCPQVEWFDRRRAELSGRRAQRAEIVLGWVGTPGTLHNLYVVWEALERLFTRYPQLHLRLVGTGTHLSRWRLPPFERVRFSQRPAYDQAGMIEEVFGMHIGLFPLQDTEASRVRGVLKATVYMSGEAAVVASPVGQSAELIQEGVNGLLAGTTQEWERQVERLILQPELRHQLARAGLETVRQGFTVQRSFERLASMLVPAAAPGPIKETA